MVEDAAAAAAATAAAALCTFFVVDVFVVVDVDVFVVVDVDVGVDVFVVVDVAVVVDEVFVFVGVVDKLVVVVVVAVDVFFVVAVDVVVTVVDDFIKVVGCFVVVGGGNDTVDVVISIIIAGVSVDFNGPGVFWVIVEKQNSSRRLVVSSLPRTMGTLFVGGCTGMETIDAPSTTSDLSSLHAAVCSDGIFRRPTRSLALCGICFPAPGHHQETLEAKK